MADGWRGGGCSSCSNCSTDAVVEAAVGSSRRKLAGEEGPSTQAPESSGTRSSSSSQSWPTGGGGGSPSHFRSQSPQKASARPRHSPVIRRVTAWRNMGTCRSARYSTALICHPLVRVNLSLQRPSQWGPDVSKSEERAPRVVCTWPGRGSLSVRTYVVRYSMYV